VTVPAAARRLPKPPPHPCAMNQPMATTRFAAIFRPFTLKIRRCHAVNVYFVSKKNLCFSSKTIVLGADPGAHVFMIFYNKNYPQPNPPILVSFSQQQKKKKNTKKRHFLNYRIN
jgi:hypothetical protein